MADALQRGIELVTQAIEADNKNDYEDAYKKYQQALDYFLLALKHEQNEESKAKIRTKVAEYLTRAETLQGYLKNKKTNNSGKGSTMPDTKHEEHAYLDLVRHVLQTGEKRKDRTGTGTVSVFAPPSIRFTLRGNTLPLLTTKRTFYKGIIEELLWFVHGSTDSTLLSKKGVKIWDGNGSKEFLENRGLGHRREGDLGPVYGFQWRHFGAEYVDCDKDYTGQGVDQLKECIRQIKENPTDRRIILSAWNPRDLGLMALPPCHLLCQFYVHLPNEDTPNAKPGLSCLMFQRSADLGLGLPFNIASYALLTHMMAHVTGTEARELIIQLGDAHVYMDHVAALDTQLGREPRAFPTLKWARDDIRHIEDFKAEDFVIDGYSPHPAIAMKMSV